MVSNGRRSCVDGVDKVLKKLHKKMEKVTNNITTEGLINAVIIIRRSMDKETPTIPVDTGNLRSSFFTVTTKGQKKINPSDGSFKGDDAGKMQRDYEGAINNSIALVNASRNPMVMFGFSAYYAAVVHETDKNYRRPGSGSKFLENAIDRNRKEILNEITKAGKI